MTSITTTLTDSVRTIQRTIVTTWLRLINSTWVPNERITDYATPLASMLDSYNPSFFTPDQNRTIQNWMHTCYREIYADAFVNPIYPTTNWQAYRIWVLAKIAFIRRDATAISFLRDRFRLYLSSSINPTTGTTQDFVHRDSLKYHCFSLCGMMQAILVLQDRCTVINPTTGTLDTVWARDTTDYRRLLQPAWNFLRPFIDGRATHAEFIDSNIASDKTRPDFGKAFVLSDALPMLRLQSRFI